MNAPPSPYGALLEKALGAPFATTELRDDEGRVARIERHESYPGAVCVRLDGTDARTPCPTHWLLPAVESRPSFYPGSVPFVTGLACRAMQAEDRLYATWRDESRSGPDPELSKRLEASVPAPLREALDDLEARREAGASVGEISLEEITERLGDDSVREWTASVMKASEPDERFVAGFEAIVSECLETGWQAEPVPDDRPAFPRMIALRHASLRRSLVLSGALGMNVLLLTQEPVEAADSG